VLSDEERARLAQLRGELAEQDPSYVALFDMREHVLGQRPPGQASAGDRVLICLTLWSVALIVSLFVQQAYGSAVAAMTCLLLWALLSAFALPRHRYGRRAPT
jgi:hypothetical protein